MTGLIYVGIIAVWAIVLVPAWLRRHDHLDPERSVDRFSRSMQTLGNRAPLPGGSLPEADRGPALEAEPEVLRVRPAGSWRAAPRTTAGRAGAGGHLRRAAARRRLVLAVLVAALGVVGALVAAGLLLPVALVVPAVLIGSFLAVARRQVLVARRTRGRRAARTPSARVRPAMPSGERSPGASSSTWEPRSAPLPTYVTAPPAPGFPRVIDTVPGAWTAAAMLERAQQEKLRAERMAAAKAEAIARAKAEQAAAEARTRDEEFLTQQAAAWEPRALHRRRVVNE